MATRRRKKARKSTRKKARKTRRKAKRRVVKRGRKKAKRSKGKIPLNILQRRAAKLVRLVKSRGGKVY